MTPLVSVIMGSTSDLPVMEKACQFLNDLQIPFEVNALSAHRTPDAVETFAKGAQARGIKVIIAAAGMAAALPGVVAASTTLPVIGVPIKGMLDGLDALLSIVQMPPGIPVATVGVNGALNAAVLATEMLALTNEDVAQRLAEYKSTLGRKIEKANRELSEVKYALKRTDAMTDLFSFHRRATSNTVIGKLCLGSDHPIRIQSMTTTHTNDTNACVEQAERIIRAGGELVRLTTQGKREAENLRNISAALRQKGYDTPLVADVHFNANVADVAARYAEKVRINPGNYVDPGRTFKQLEYTDEEYAEEIKKIEARFVPFLRICREKGTAVRIGVNHGSLSDRIMSRYGDTPEGIVESCMEFLRICRREAFENVVISIKASNTVVMVQSVRLLVQQMEAEGMCYPLHLGVTEAGEGEDGRIKSAVGIGTLLADGIGDTIRVSLSEEPEAEIPVARALVDYVSARAHHLPIPARTAPDFHFLAPERRPTHTVLNIGGEQVPVVVASRMKPESVHIVTHADLTPDYLYIGSHLPERLSEGRRYIMDYEAYLETVGTRPQISNQVYPIFPHTAIPFLSLVQADVKFLVLQYGANSDEYLAYLRHHPEVVVVCMSTHKNKVADQRALVHELWTEGLTNPVVFAQMYRHSAREKEAFQLEAAADMGPLMIDALTDGIWLMNDGDLPNEDIDATAFGVLQAARLRTSKTEYISCPGCGRTLYDLRTTIARIREATREMKGLKIGIMGCIVNGPGEMADADFGYVGAGPGKVSLYRKKECVERNIDEKDAVEHLLRLIQSSSEKEKR